MKKILIALIFLLFGRIAFAQQNLIRNPSFEEYITCPYTNSCPDCFFKGWKFAASPDLYNTCGTNGFGIPISWGGGEESHSGNGYAGFAPFIVCGPIYKNVGEYLVNVLLDTLKPGHKYDMEFYVSLQDSTWYATRKFEAYFNMDTNEMNQIIWTYNYDDYKLLQPQLYIGDTNFITNKTGWAQVKGSFFAQGGERAMILGNFKDDDLMDSMYVGGAAHGPHPEDTLWFRACYYFIDDVSLIEDTSYHPIGIEEEQLKLVKLGYFDGAIQLSGLLFERQNSKLKLYSLEGKSLGVFSIPAGTAKILIEGISKGNYIYELLVSNQVVKRGKLWVGE